METLDSLKKTLNTSKGIKQVATTMKVLSAANIKKYEKVVKVLKAYKDTVELALLGVCAGNRNVNFAELQYAKRTEGGDNLAIVFGSNQGLCGRYNDKMIDFVLNDFSLSDLNNKVVVVGDRLQMLIEDKKLNIIKTLSIPSSMETTTATIHDIVQLIDSEINSCVVNRVTLYYTLNDDSASGTVTKIRLIPIDDRLLNSIKKRRWITNNIPSWQVDTTTLVSNILRQYIFVVLNSAMINAMASEQKNRLITLQNAEKNISDLIKSKTLEYNQKRQTTITSELLDVITGYKVSNKKKCPKT